jgi:hypothetical protein
MISLAGDVAGDKSDGSPTIDDVDDVAGILSWTPM